MNFKSLFILPFLVLFSLSLFPQQDTNKVNKGKMLVVTGGMAVALGKKGQHSIALSGGFREGQGGFGGIHYDLGNNISMSMNYQQNKKNHQVNIGMKFRF